MGDGRKRCQTPFLPPFLPAPTICRFVPVLSVPVAPPSPPSPMKMVPDPFPLTFPSQPGHRPKTCKIAR